MHALLVGLLLIQTSAASTVNGGVVTGRIIGIDGTPAAGVRISAAAPKQALQPAPAAAGITSMAKTDNDGRYRLENIPPGQYYITAGLLDLPTYYPGTLSPESAKVLSITAGSMTTDIDFSLGKGTGGRVKGRLAVLPTLKRSTQAVITLTSPTTSLVAPPSTFLSTTLRDDGTFEFPMVRPGTYSLGMSIGTIARMQILVGDVDVMIVLAGEPAGARVVGKTVMPEATPGVPIPTTPVFLAVATNGIPAYPPAYSTDSNSDGTFEFLRIPPGTYSLYSRVHPEDRQTLVVADKDLRVELGIPFEVQIPGRIVLEGGLAAPEWNLQSWRAGAEGYGRPLVGTEGSFLMRLSQGQHRIVLAELPAEYIVRSMTYGDVDLMKSTLDAGPGKPVGEIRITVGRK